MKLITTTLLLLTAMVANAQHSDYGDPSETDYKFLYIVGFPVVLIACIFITRAIFSIPKFLKYELLKTKLQIIDLRAKYKDNELVLQQISKAIQQADISEDFSLQKEVEVYNRPTMTEEQPAS